MSHTWRTHAARLYVYLDTGEALLNRVWKVLVAAAAFKYLGVPLWGLVILTPAVVVGYIVLGRLWVTHGWYRQQMAANVVNALDPVQRFIIEAHVRMLQHHGIPINGYDPTLPPEGLEHLLMSGRG